MKRYLKILLVPILLVMLLMATAVPAFADTGPPGPPDTGGLPNVEPEETAVGHLASCTSQEIVVHSVPLTPSQDALHELYHEQCADLDDHVYPD